MKRIQRKNTKGWKLPPNTVYVGRNSKYENPFRVVKIGKTFHIKTDGSDICNKILTDNFKFKYITEAEAIEDSIKCFRMYLFPYNHSKSDIQDFYISVLNHEGLI
jgi:hypothetical protein